MKKIWKMRKSIAYKIFIYMFMFSLVIVIVIGASTKFILPAYYLQQQLEYLENAESTVRAAYSDQEMEIVFEQMEQMENELGGELYYYSEITGHQGYGMGKGRNRMTNPNSETFVPSGDVSSYQYTNKIGIDIYVIGVLLEDNYLIYEVSIQTLNQATDTMLEFIGILLAIVLALAVLVSFVLSKKISKPIRD